VSVQGYFYFSALCCGTFHNRIDIDVMCSCLLSLQSLVCRGVLCAVCSAVNIRSG